jgi:hypothetical protein
MENKFFVNDLIQEVGNINAVNSYNFQFEEYEFVEIEGKKFIKGIGKAVNPYTNENLLEGPELLFSLVNLVKGNLPQFFDKEFMDPVVSDNDVLQWVKKNGIPYRDKELHYLNVLNLEHFKRRVAWLTARFNLWKAIVEENLNEVKKWNFALQKYDDLLKVQFAEETNELVIYQKALAKKIGDSMKVKISLDYTNGFKFIVETDDLFSVAYYQFAALMTKEPSDSKKKMKHCSYCNSIFWAKSAKKKYCSKCDRRTIWSRKQKEA